MRNSLQRAGIAITISNMQFAWDKRKAASNLKKHGISFAEAASVFGDSLSLTFPDPDHSEDEERFITIGMSETGTALCACRPGRGYQNNLCKKGDSRREELL